MDLLHVLLCGLLFSILGRHTRLRGHALRRGGALCVPWPGLVGLFGLVGLVSLVGLVGLVGPYSGKMGEHMRTSPRTHI